LNALAQKDRVIVTPYPGTTRDVVEEEISVGGFPVRIIDTAGIQETTHPIEREGIARSRQAFADADLVLCVWDASQTFDVQNDGILSLIGDKPRVIVLNKSDLPDAKSRSYFQSKIGDDPCVACSSLAAPGTQELEDKIFSFISGGQSGLSDEIVLSTVRQKDLLGRFEKCIREAAAGARANISPELIAVDVRLALQHLGFLVGETVTDDVLELLFSQFCIGK